MLEAAHEALTDRAIAKGGPEYGYLRTAVAIAIGKRDSGGIGTPVGIRNQLSDSGPRPRGSGASA